MLLIWVWDKDQAKDKVKEAPRLKILDLKMLIGDLK